MYTLHTRQEYDPFLFNIHSLWLVFTDHKTIPVINYVIDEVIRAQCEFTSKLFLIQAILRCDV